MKEANRFKVNFFKPHSDLAKANMKLIVTLAIIWAVAVFGFQFLLIGTNKSVPEPQYEIFQEVWPTVSTGLKADSVATQKFAKSVLTVLGKNISLKAPHKEVMQGALSATLFALLPDSQAVTFSGDPAKYVAENDMHDVLGLGEKGFDRLMYSLLPTSVVSVPNCAVSDDVKNQIPAIMELYLVHNRSAITDFTFLGFPFHYWYTAQFLLILFVGLCIIYAVFIDKLNQKYNVSE